MMTDQELIELGKTELVTLGLVQVCDVEDGTVVRMPKADREWSIDRLDL